MMSDAARCRFSGVNDPTKTTSTAIPGISPHTSDRVAVPGDGCAPRIELTSICSRSL